jgi:hypothetical protein
MQVAQLAEAYHKKSKRALFLSQFGFCGKVIAESKQRVRFVFVLLGRFVCCEVARAGVGSYRTALTLSSCMS